MTSIDEPESNSRLGAEDAETMERLGITRVPVDYFHFGEFRYTNLRDAVAQATRHRPRP